jgi:hypothetical protein
VPLAAAGAPPLLLLLLLLVPVLLALRLAAALSSLLPDPEGTALAKTSLAKRLAELLAPVLLLLLAAVAVLIDLWAWLGCWLVA